MALFGSDMVQVTTPDGRQLTLPRGLAAGFPGLQPVVQPPPLPVAPPPPTFDAGDNAMLEKAKATPPTDSPVTSPLQVPRDEPPIPAVPRGPVTDPAQDQGAPNSPTPLTNNDLAKIGNAGVYEAERRAIGATKEATRQQGEAIADQATAIGNQMAEADTHAQKLLEERQRVAQENAAALQAKTEEYTRNAKAIADTKVDRSVNHPILAAIGVALGGIGSVLKGEGNNPALDALYKAIDRKVAGQMRDLDKRRADLGVQRDALSMQREQGRDRLSEMDTYRLAYIEQAKRQVETIRQKTQSDVVRRNADVALAGLDQQAAQTLGSAVGREQTLREAQAARAQTAQQHRETLAVTMRGQDMQAHDNDLNRQERAQEKLDTISAQLLARGDKESAEKAKAIQERGLHDPSTGDPMLTPEGQNKMAEADKAEAQARAATDPAKAKSLNERAALLRQSAQQNDIALAQDKESREKNQQIANYTQNITNNINTMRKMLEGGPSVFDRETWAAAVSGLKDVKKNWAQLTGERMTVGAFKAADDLVALHPEQESFWGSMYSRAADVGKTLKQLDLIENSANQEADVALKGNGIKSGWRPFKRTKETEIKGSTAAEIGKDATPSPISRGVTHLLNPISGADEKIQAPQDEAQAAALGRKNAAGQTGNYGLDPSDDDRVRALIKRSSGVNHSEFGQIVDSLAQPLSKISGDQARPSLAIGVAKLIRDEDPKLLDAALAKLPAVKAKEIKDTITLPPELAKIGRGAKPNLSFSSPESKAKYNEYLRSVGLPEVE